MIPLKDDTPRLCTPFVTYFLIVANVVVFLFERSLPPRAAEAFVYQFGWAPSLLGQAVRHHEIMWSTILLPVVTSMFLHSGWWHLLSNMWALWIFGDNIEDYVGHTLYLVFYLCGGIAAAAVHTLFNLGSPVPIVGASGAIAAMMGAYFALYPGARVLTLVPFIFVFFLWLPAWVVLGYWFVVQFLSGAASSLTSGSDGGGIAFWAHVGGFVAGMLLIHLLPGRTRRYRYGRR